MILDFLSQLDTHIITVSQALGCWTYVLLFFIIFAESGLFFAPFLPGESLLFALGTISAIGALDIHLLSMLLIIAAIIGGFVNYYIGEKIGEWLMRQPKFQPFKPYLQRTHNFYEKYGAKTILLARLIPIIRTYAPFVAGMAAMNKRLFALYNILGGILWISGFLYVSFYFGNIPIIKQHFSWIIIGIIIISVIPVLIELSRNFLRRKKTA